MRTGVAVLGSTGSIGRSALAVLDRHRDRFRVVALAAHRNAAELCAQVDRFRPDIAVLVDGDARTNGASGTHWKRGAEALNEVAMHEDVDIVINAVVGAAGLSATLAALNAGKRLALANKESLVIAGPLVRAALEEGGGELIPVDSEHSAILQCLRGAEPNEARRLILTASGGPFRDWDPSALARVTPADALRHPTWNMGAKITVDSATLVNKALEVIEAHYLFGMPYDRLDVVVHPQSIVHSFVEFVDGSVLAQMGEPTMELPILYALSYPSRLVEASRPFDPVTLGPLTFQPVDTNRFPAFRLGLEAARLGGTAPAVFNGANEVAVERFLAGELPFTDIAAAIEAALAAHTPTELDSLEAVLAADRQGREVAREMKRRSW